MTPYRFFDFPERIPLQRYDEELDRMTRWLLQFPEVVSVYQIGGVSSPGISDLDLVTILKDDTRLNVQPLSGLGTVGKKLFIHQLYGVTESHFRQACDYSFFHNYRLLGGKPQDLSSTLSLQDQKLLKRQIAYEFLLKMYVNASLQKTYRQIKVRSLLLQLKGLVYDLEFLGVTSGDLYTSVTEFMEIRTTWFESAPDTRRLQQWFDPFILQLQTFLKAEWAVENIYISPNSNPRIARNITLRKGPGPEVQHRGIRFPLPGVSLQDRVKILNRLNHFSVTVPFADSGFPEVIRKYFAFTQSHAEYNRNFLPAFYTLTSSLKI